MSIENIIQALGSKENINVVEACMTLLRVSLKDNAAINKQALTDFGILDVITVPNGVQLIVGTKAQQYRDEINQYL